MRAAGCVLVLVPTIFFATVTYVSDSSQIVTERVRSAKATHWFSGMLIG